MMDLWSKGLPMEFCWILLTLATYIPGLSAVSTQNIYSSGCSNNRIRLECPDFHKIAVKRLFYGVKSKNDTDCIGNGRHSVDCCRPTHNDCLVVDDTKYPFLNMLCSGHRGCDIEVKVINSGSTCIEKGFGPATDYMSVVHDCIPDDSIASLCSDRQLKGKQLYLSNKNYPYPIKAGRKKCQCEIKTGRTSGLDLHALDIIFTMSEGGKQCQQNILITDDDGFQKQFSCGHSGLYGFRNIYSQHVNSVSLTLNSYTNKSQGYVWIQAKASDPSDYVEMYCGREMLGYTPLEEGESRIINKEPDITVPVTGDVTDTNLTRQGSPPVITDMVALVAGVAVAGTVVIIIGLIGIIILCVRRSQEKRMRRNAPPFPSPMVASDSNKHASNSYCKYDYDEDKYCSIKRSPMRMSKFSNHEKTAEQKLKEAFLDGVAPEQQQTNQNNYANYPQQLAANQTTPLLDKKEESDGNADLNENTVPKPEYITMGTPVQPRSVMREITVSTLPEKRKIKNKTVTFSPVAMVTPLPSGSEESVPEDFFPDDPKGHYLEMYSKSLPLRSSSKLPQSDKTKKVVIVPGTRDDSYLATFQGQGCENVTEEDLWKAFHIKLDENQADDDFLPPPPVIDDDHFLTEDENPYDNLPYINTDSIRSQIADIYNDQKMDTYRKIRNPSQKPSVESIPES